MLYKNKSEIGSGQADKWNTLNPTKYIRVGEVIAGSPLNLVGMPASNLYFDVSKITKEMSDHEDHIEPGIIKEIPSLLNDPIVITEYKPGTNSNTVNIYGNLSFKDTPVVVGIVATLDRNGRSYINKIRTVHARRDFAKNITDKSVLYLNENKKETLKWFQAQEQHVPMRGKHFGLIRSIQLNYEIVKWKVSKGSVKNLFLK